MSDKPNRAGEQLLVEHYKAARTEIISRLEGRRRLSALIATAAAAIFGIYLKNPGYAYALAVLPLIALYGAATYAHNDMSIRAISVWLRTDYTVALSQFAALHGISPLMLSHWDCANVENNEVRVFASRVRYSAVSFLLGTVHITASVTLVRHLVANGDVAGAWWAGSVFGIALLCGIYVLRRTQRHRQKTSGQKEPKVNAAKTAPKSEQSKSDR